MRATLTSIKASFCAVNFILMAIPLWANQTNDIADLDLQGLLDNIVLSASKHEETLEEAPANVFIITREMIDSYGCIDIDEALSMVPGIYITDDYSLSQIGVRGFSSFGDWNTRMMVLVDGRPTGEQYGGTNSIDNTAVRIENIDRIEIIKGPSSTLYGSNAFLGIVNLITVKPVKNELFISGDYYSRTDTKGTNLRIFQKFNKDFTFYATGNLLKRYGNDLYFEEFSDSSDQSLFNLDDDGYNQYYLTPSDFTGGFSWKRNFMDQYSTYGRIDWRNSHLIFEYSSMDNGIPHGFYGAVFNRPENQFREKKHFIDIGLSDNIGTRINFDVRLAYNYFAWSDHIFYNYYSLEDEPSYLPGPIWVDFEFNKFVSSEIKFQAKLSDKNDAVFGSEIQFHNIRHESGESDKNGDEVIDNVIPIGHIEHNGQIYNLFVQDEHAFSDRLELVTGLHLNYYTYTTGRVVPKGALIFQPYKNTAIKLIASQGFRSPTFYEITFDDSQYFIGNPDLKPELISSYDLIMTRQFPYGFTLDFALNQSDLSNMIIQTVVDISNPAHPGGDYLDEVSQFNNVGKMKTNSLEMSIQRNPIYDISGFANITYQKFKIEDAGQSNTIFNSPRWLGNAGLIYQLIRNKLSVSAKGNFIGSRNLWDGSSIKSQFTVDLNVQVKKIYGYFDISAGIKNLLDKEYRVPLSYDYAPTTSIQRPRRSLHLIVQTTLGL